MKPKENGKTRGVAAIVSAAKLKEVAEKAEKDAMATRKILLECIGVLLANYDFLSCDLISTLEDEKGRIEGEVSEDEKGCIESEVSEDIPGGETGAEIIEPVGEDNTLGAQLQMVKGFLSFWQASYQRKVLERYLAEVLPGMEVEELIEEARDTARDELLDFISEFSYEWQADYYRTILEGTKDMEVQLA